MKAPAEPGVASAGNGLRALPSVEDLVNGLPALSQPIPRAVVVAEARRLLQQRRERILAAEPASIDTLAADLQSSLEALTRPSLRRVINATGVVLHTNLGRAPLGPIAPIPGYSNLEYDLAAGRRGKRDVHAGALLERLLGKPAIVVNNNAAATFLALNELAAGHEAIVARGELIEIGDGFRIPDIMQRAGAVLREVGATNKSTLDDYRAAINERTRLILRVHPSNFHISGFTAKPELRQIAALAREHNIPLYEDLGSGCIADLRASGIDEPLVSDSLDAGVNLVSFSGDKLLGGPQAGILAGDPALVVRLRRNPLFRALRVDKLLIGVLEQTLRRLLLQQWDEIPALRMIRLSAESIRERSARLASAIGGSVVAGQSLIGGGSTPDQSVPTFLVVVPGDAARMEQRLRQFDPPVVARIERDRLLLDLRTVDPAEEEELQRVVEFARSR